MSDELIRQALIEKDEEVLQTIVNQYSKLLWAVSYSILGKKTNTAEIETIVSDVFLRLWRNPEKYEVEKSSLKTYLVMICKSLSLNSVRGSKKILEMDDSFILENFPEKNSDEGKYWQYFYEAVEELSEPTKTICIQRFFFEVKPSAISNKLGLSITEVNNRLYKGKQKIRKKISQLILNEGE